MTFVLDQTSRVPHIVRGYNNTRDLSVTTAEVKHRLEHGRTEVPRVEVLGFLSEIRFLF